MPDTLKNILIIAGALIAVLILRSSVVEAFRIPSESMEPTLQVNDYILVWKLAYGLHIPFNTDTVTEWRSPKRGEQIVFRRNDDPQTEQDESKQYMIKRVIGLPGETVEVKGQKVLINNRIINEPYAVYRQGGIPEGHFGPTLVPPKSFFVLGDNRDQSSDSRFWKGGHFVPLKKIVGNAFVVYMSTHSVARIGTILR